MSETKLINFDVINTKPTKPILITKQLNSFDDIVEESELKRNNSNSGESLPYERIIDNIASSTSGIIDYSSVVNSPKQILNTSVSHDKLEISTTNKEILKRQLLALGNSHDDNLPSTLIMKKSINENKARTSEKESSTNSPLQSTKYVSIDVLNNSTILDIADANTISNEVMTLSSEDEGIIHKANSEISETTLNQSQPQAFSASCFEGTNAFRLSTGAIELPRSVSPSSPSSPSSQSSLIYNNHGHQILTTRSYSALALIEDINNGSPLRNSISVYSGSNYTFSYANSMTDDGNDSESVLAKKKKSVRFSNIVDVIDSDENNTLAKLKALDTEDKIGSNEDQDSNQDLIFPELTTVINIEDDNHELTSMNSSLNNSSHSSFLVKIEEAIAIVFRYIILAISSFWRLFKIKQNKKNKKGNRKDKNQYAIINDNGITDYTSLTVSLEEDIKLNEGYNLSKDSIVDDIAPITISQSSLNDNKELNSTMTISEQDKSKSPVSFSFKKLCISKNNENDVELYPLNNSENKENNNDELNNFPEKPKNVHMSVTSVSSITITNKSENLKGKIVSSPLTINTLSQQKGDRVVRYWYKDPKRKTMAQRFGLTKSLNSSDVLNKSNKKKLIVEQVDKSKYPILVSKKMPESVITAQKIKRSSLVNFTPTNIDINNIPNISATTTTNTILNSTSSYRGEKSQNLALNNTDTDNDTNTSSNDSGKNNNENDGIHQHHGKEIVIRDLNSNDEIYYAFNLVDANKGKIDFQTKDKQGKVLSSSIISNKNGQTILEKNETNSPTSPSSTNSSSSLSSTSSSDKEPLRKSARRFNHRRQNSVRLQISY